MMLTMEASLACFRVESEQFSFGTVPLYLHAQSTHETLQQISSAMETIRKKALKCLV